MDISYLLFLQEFRQNTNGIFDKFFTYATEYGEMACLLPLFALIYWCINKKTGEFMFLSLAFARIVNGLIKIVACVYRPWIRDARIQPIKKAFETATGYSFPSGHTANSVATFGSYAVREEKVSKYLKILLWTLPVIIGFSRNYIGVHTPQDVVCAFILSAASIFAVKKLYDYLETNEKSDIWIVIGGLALSGAVLLYTKYKSYPMDYDAAGKLIVDPAKMVLDSYKNLGYCFGIFIGWIIERRFINFSLEHRTVNQKIFRYLVCFVLMQIMLTIICPQIKAYTSAEVSHFFVAFLKTFYIICIAPFIIKTCKL